MQQRNGGSASGDPPEDFAQLYRGHFNRVAVQMYAYLGDHAEAQDVTQEAFCRALERWTTIGGYADPSAWVRRVAWNLATSRLGGPRSPCVTWPGSARSTCPDRSPIGWLWSGHWRRCPASNGGP